MAAGYSKRSLVQKLGIKAGFKIMLLNPPQNYDSTLGPLPEDVIVLNTLEEGPYDFVHFFTTDKATLDDQLPSLKQALVSNGMLWISWPKASSKVETDLKEDLVRDIGLANGLVDVKVAAIDETWSALKFVYRLKDRE